MYWGAQRIGLEPGDAVLVPAYHHGSEIEALLQAGLELRYYEATPSLAPDPVELESLLAGRARALYLIHPLGHPLDAARWRRWCDERGLLLIEDAAQAWLATHEGRPVGSDGDLALFCLYKTFGLAEGAAVVARAPLDEVPIDPRIGAWELAVRNVRWAVSRSPLLYALMRAVPRRRVAATGDEFELRDPHAGPWRHTWFILRRIADPAAAERRRANHRALAQRLGHLVPAPFDALPAGASPFAFPVEAEDPAALEAALEEAAITYFPLWREPHPSLPVARFPAAAARRARTIALPVHQELRPRDLERIADVVYGASSTRSSGAWTAGPSRDE